MDHSFSHACIEVNFCDAAFTNIKTVCFDCHDNQPTCKNLDVPSNTKSMQFSFAANHSSCVYSIDNNRTRIFNQDVDMIQCEVSALYNGSSFPDYVAESARLQTFDQWPKTKKQTPHELSVAGFFYTLKNDRVICFCCGGGLYDWDDLDNPWEQHELYYPGCEYLLLNKVSKYIAQ